METLFGILVPITFITLLVVERVAPGRPLPRVRWWLAKGIAFFVSTAVISTVVPALIAMALAPYAPFHLDLPLPLAGLVGFAVVDLASYLWHRVTHNVPWLWRWTHQMHHSAERVDVAGGAIFHPFDTIAYSVVGGVGSVMLGLSPAAAALAGLVSAFTGMFSHLNVRTPRWLGYIVQRPESHAIHHARGVHAYNYGNLSVWDIAFGTFRNPESFCEPAGFWDGASRRLGAMMIGRDISTREETI